MAARSGGSSFVPSLPPPCPKSPPEYPDLYGKRRETAKVQMLEREISFLEEELKSVEDLQPASRCCKEVTDFVMENSDPLIPTSRKNRKSCRFWKWLWYQFLVLLSYIYSLLDMECPALTCHGSAVAVILGPATAAHLTAVHANAAHVSVVHVNAAHVSAVHVNAIHIAVVADGNALGLNVQGYAFAAVVQKPVVIHSAYYSNILMQFRSESLILNMSLNFCHSIAFMKRGKQIETIQLVKLVGLAALKKTSLGSILVPSSFPCVVC
ncbi:hypothetical protein CRYUN_Cryun26dG0043200 [Craigia yunnanensis]